MTPDPRPPARSALLVLQRARRAYGRRPSPRVGQVATYLVVWTAIIVLLTVALMNIGQLAMMRTSTANAADAAVLSLASTLGAAARYQCDLLDSSGDCEVQCSDHGEFVLNILFGVILIAIGIVACLTGIGCAAGIGLIVAGVAQLVVTAIKVGAITPHQISVFNERMEELSEHDQIRESTILGAFVQLVDDPRQEPDFEPGVPAASDIDRDGDTTELVGAFSKWFNRRLIQLDNDMHRARNLIRNFVMNILMEFRQHSHEFREWMNGDFSRTLQWVEDADPAAPFDVPWWQPGTQLPNMNTYPGSGRRAVRCEPGVTCTGERYQLVDEVDWMLGTGRRVTRSRRRLRPRGDLEIIDGTPRAFEAWVRELVRCRAGNRANCRSDPGRWDPSNFRIRRRAIRKIGVWNRLLQGYWSTQIGVWRGLVSGWITDLSAIRAGMCLRFGNAACLPPSGGLAGISGHPIDAAINELRAFLAELDTLMVETTAFQPKHVSRDRPVYRWRDERGWHMVRVEVSDFTVPHAEVWDNIVTPMESPVCFLTFVCQETCVGIEAREGQVSVRVTRFDQDQLATRGMPFRMRDFPQGSRRPPAPGAVELIESERYGVISASRRDFDLTNLSPAYLHDMLDRYGITSTSRARYTWRPNSVQLRRVR